jgi:CRISPR/Cas system Type II protein with McrA/HNH and RuvC-like nuclease domain
MTKRYAARYDFHQGMLHVLDVPGFEWIYIHTGNTDDHTSGCLLVGYTKNEDALTIGHSRAAYTDLYKAVVAAAKAGDLEIEYQDEGETDVEHVAA